MTNSQTSKSVWPAFKQAKKLGTLFVILTTILWALGVPLGLLLPGVANAAVTATGATNMTFSGQKAKANAVVPVLKVVLSQAGGETRTLSNVAVTITGSGGFTAADLVAFVEGVSSPIVLFRDANGNGTFESASDSLITGGELTNVNSTTWTSNILLFTPEILPNTPTAYFVVAMIASTPTVDHAFKVTIADNGVTLSANSPTITPLTATDVNNITITDDSTGPTSIAGFPGGSSVPVEAYLDRVFNESLNPNSVNTGTVILQAGGAGPNLCTGVSLTTSGSNPNDKVVCPHSVLTANTSYTLTLSGIQDAAGNTMGAMAPITFTTSTFSGGNNTTGPMIMQTYPGPGTNNIPANVKITLAFPMGPEGNMKTGASVIGSVENHAYFTLMQLSNIGVPTGSDICGATGCSYSWNSTSRILTITPTTALTINTNYRFSVSGLQNAQSVAMAGTGAFEIPFMVGAGSDSAAPTLRANSPTNPINAATGVSPYAGILEVFFSEALDSSAVSLSTVRLCQDSTVGTAGCEAGDTRLTDISKFNTMYDSYDKAVRLSPIASDALAASTKYCFEIVGGGSGVKDAAGNPFAATASTNCFTTGAATDPVAGSPKLLFSDADNFKLVAHFSEPMRFSGLVDDSGKVVTANVDLQCPSGVTVTLTDKVASYISEFNELEIRSLGLTTDSTCRLAITNAQDMAGNAMDTSNSNNIANFKILNSSTTGGFLGSGGVQNGGDFFGGMGGTAGTFWENPQRCQPRTQVTNKATSMECEFPAPAALASGSTFTLSFPSGFTLSTANGNTRAVPATQSWMNTDLNGPATNAPVIASVSTDTSGKTVIVTTGTAAIASGDMIRFELDRLTTPTTPADDLRVSIIIKDNTGVKIGQTIQAAPFPIQEAGSLAISGKVCKGSTSGGACGGSDTGIANVRIFCDSMGGFGDSGGMMGHQETTTAGDGTWSITGLSNGQYGCGMPPGLDALNNLGSGGAGNFQNIVVSGSSRTGVDFRFADLSTTGKTLTVNITSSATLANEQIDIFCSAGGFDAQFSAPMMKMVTLNGSGAGTTTLKLQPGNTYNCGLGPHIPQESMSSGGPPPMPTFNFMPPKPTDVVVPTDVDPSAVTFALVVASNSITGFVKDGSNNGIANVFIHAAPVGCFDVSTGEGRDCFGGFTQSKSDGSFTLNVAPGTYIVGADAPGMPTSGEQEVTVDTSGTLSQKGTTITSVTVKMVKSTTTISGQVIDESGNGIKYANVNAEKIATGGTCASFTPVGGHADSPTDQSGNYTLYVSNGTWCLRAFAPSYGEVNNKTVVISSDTSATGQNIEATASSFGTISGTVAKGGTAVGGAFVSCHGTSGGNGLQSNADGTFSLNVRAGSGYTCDGFIHGAGPLTPQTDITVPSGGTVAVTLSMGNSGTVNVTITGVTDAFVDVRDSNGRGNGTGMSNNGIYTIKVPAGTYTVRGGGPKYGELCAGQSITVTAGGTNAVTCTAPANLRTVTGRVYDGTSNIIGAKVILSNSSSGRFFDAMSTAVADPDNNFGFTNVPEGTYNVQVFRSGYEPATTTAAVSGGNLTMSTPIALTKASGSNGTSQTIAVQSNSSAYIGEAKVVATKSGKVIVAEADKTTGNATLNLTNGTWSVQAYGDNGKTSSAGSVVVSGGTVQGGSTATLSLATDISGYTSMSDTQTMVPSAGGLIKSDQISGLEINVPGSTLSTSDSNTGKIDISSDSTIGSIDPGTDMNFVGSSGFDITPKDSNGNTLGKTLSGDAVTLTLPYTDAEVSTAGVDESKLVCGSYSTTSQIWETFPTIVDTANNKITCQVNHFSSFGVLGSLRISAGGNKDATPPAAPTNTQLTADSAKVTITWNDPADSDLDKVEILRNSGGTTSILNDPYAYVSKGVKTFVDTSVTQGLTYKYQLRAKDTSTNASLTAVYSILVPASGQVGSSPSPTTTVSPAQPTTTPVEVVTPTPKTPVSTVTPAPTAALVAVLIKDPTKLDEILANLSLVRKQSEEAKYMPLIKSDAIAFKVKLTSEQETAITNFVSYGISEKTKQLGAGERRAVLRDYLETVSRPDVKWEDIERMTKGEKPVSRNLAKEQAQVKSVLKIFIKVVGHKPNFQDAKEDLAWNTLMYRIRFERDLAKEKVGITEFRQTFKRLPKSPLDWSAVRALGYAL